MLINPTIAKLQALGLGAMASALADQLATPGPWGELDFEDRLGLLVDREADARDSRRLATRLKAAKRAIRRRWRTSTSAPREGSTAPWCWTWPGPAGSPATTTWS